MVSSASHKHRIAIVGGGISGLSAAKKLIDAGNDVDIFEASDRRIGGKIETATFNGKPFNAGAEFIDSHSEMFKLARELHIPLIEAKDQKSGIFHMPNNKVISEKELLTAFRPVSEQIERDKAEIERDPGGELAKKIDKMSVRDYFQHLNHEAESKASIVTRVLSFLHLKKNPNSVPKDILETVAGVYTSEGGRDTISARQFVAESNRNLSPESGSLLASDCHYRVEGGTERIVEALKEYAETKGAKIHKGAKAKALHKHGQKFSIDFEKPQDGAGEYDQVVLAAPMHSLAEIKGLDQLGLSKEALGALQEGQYTHSSKMVVKLKPGIAEKIGNDTFLSASGIQSWRSDDETMTFLIGGEKANSLKGQKLVDHVLKTYAGALGMKPEDIFDVTSEPPLLRGPDAKMPCYASPAPSQVAKLHALSASFDEMAQQGVGVVGTFIPSRGAEWGSVGFMDNGVESAGRVSEIFNNGNLARAQAMSVAQQTNLEYSAGSPPPRPEAVGREV